MVACSSAGESSMLSISYTRSVVDEPYWGSYNFMPDFLRNDINDHHYLIDSFKVICGEPVNRKAILEYLLQKNGVRGPFLYNEFDCEDEEDAIWPKLSKCMRQCLGERKTGLLSFPYPIIDDETEDNAESDELSHYIMLIVSPEDSTLYHIDSRGLHFAPNEHHRWRRSLSMLKKLFNAFQWVDVVKPDLQLATEGDHFCQTWSLLLTVQFLMARQEAGVDCKRIVIPSLLSSPSPSSSSSSNRSHKRPRYEQLIDLTMTDGDTNSSDEDELSYWRDTSVEVCWEDGVIVGPHGLTPIIVFWRSIMEIPFIKEALFYEIYSNTHGISGERCYHRYFSVLEDWVLGGAAHRCKVVCSSRVHSVGRGVSKIAGHDSHCNSDSKGVDSAETVVESVTLPSSGGLFYPHGVSYLALGYTFMEDFVYALDDALLKQILK